MHNSNILQLEDNMAKLRIKYFGPITEGFDSEDGFIDFSKSASGRLFY